MKMETTCVIEMNEMKCGNGNTVIVLQMSFEVDIICVLNNIIQTRNGIFLPWKHVPKKCNFLYAIDSYK